MLHVRVSHNYPTPRLEYLICKNHLSLSLRAKLHSESIYNIDVRAQHDSIHHLHLQIHVN